MGGLKNTINAEWKKVMKYIIIIFEQCCWKDKEIKYGLWYNIIV